MYRMWLQSSDDCGEVGWPYMREKGVHHAFRLADVVTWGEVE